MNLEMKVKEIMKKDPIIVAPDESLAEVSKKMASKNTDIVVVKEDDTVKGLVTAGEIFHAMRSYVLGKYMIEAIPMDIREVKIGELMATPVAIEFMMACGLADTNACVVLGEENTVADAMRVMAISGLDHILIVGDSGVVGTLSDNDLLKVFK